MSAVVPCESVVAMPRRAVRPAPPGPLDGGRLVDPRAGAAFRNAVRIAVQKIFFPCYFPCSQGKSPSRILTS
jgi:hypothetical protein